MTEENLIVDPVVRAMMEDATLGEQIKLFMQGDIGRYIIERAKADADEALSELANVDPEDPKAIREAQMKLRVVERVLSWLQDAITAGNNAMRELHEES